MQMPSLPFFYAQKCQKKIPADVLKRMVSKKFSLFLTLVNNLYQYILKTPTTVFFNLQNENIGAEAGTRSSYFQ